MYARGVIRLKRLSKGRSADWSAMTIRLAAIITRTDADI